MTIISVINEIRNNNITYLDHKHSKSKHYYNTADKKNLGISINSTGWYVQEYIRQ